MKKLKQIFKETIREAEKRFTIPQDDSGFRAYAQSLNTPFPQTVTGEWVFWPYLKAFIEDPMVMKVLKK